MEIVAILGEGASGKTTLAQSFMFEPNFNVPVQDTTRPPRVGEVDGRDYNYMDVKEFMKRTHISEYNILDGWWYGYSIDSLEQGVNVLVVNPSEYEQIKHYCTKNSIRLTSFLLNIPKEVRAKRMLERGDRLDEVYRRVIHDDGHFQPLRVSIETGIGDYIPHEIDCHNLNTVEIKKIIFKKTVDKQ